MTSLFRFSSLKADNRLWVAHGKLCLGEDVIDNFYIIEDDLGGNLGYTFDLVHRQSIFSAE